MSDKRKTVLLRAARTAGASALAWLTAWIAGPDVSEIIGNGEYAVLLAAVLTPIFAALEKAIRYGNDPGEDLG